MMCSLINTYFLKGDSFIDRDKFFCLLENNEGRNKNIQFHISISLSYNNSFIHCMYIEGVSGICTCS